MKKTLSLVLVVLMLCSIGITAFAEDKEALNSLFPLANTAERLPDYMPFHQALGINAIDDVKYGTIVYGGEPNSTCADIELADLKEYLTAHWDFCCDLVVGPYNDSIVKNGYYINIWTDEKELETSNNQVKHTIYISNIIYGGYGKMASKSRIEYSYNYIWYKPRGNAANSLYIAAEKIFEKYKDKTRSLDNYDGNIVPSMGNNYLPLAYASEWAKPELQKAASYNFLPYHLTNQYQKNISRQQFCELAYSLISSVKGNAVNDVIYDKGLYDKIDKVSYTDLEYPTHDIRYLTVVGIVNGMGDGSFNPDGLLTREQAATILHRMVDFVGKDIPDIKDVKYYYDEDSISDWAKMPVFTMREMAIMKGISDYDFSPKSAYTTEQAVATMVRLYERK